MKKLFLLSLVFASVPVAHAQKKLTLVTQSTLTGIGLPNGSRQDSRLLSVAAAATLLEMESEKANTKVQNTEVLLLPADSQIKFNKDSLEKRLRANNWKITVAKDDEYLWLQKDTRFVITYFSIGSNETSLYFAEATTTPNFKGQAENTPTSQPIVQPVVAPVIQPESKPVLQTTPVNSSIIGTWRRGKGVTGYGGRWSSTGYQYTFNANGTYTYIIKTYVEGDPETLLRRESGMFTVSGNTVTLDPKTHVIEAWSKPAGFEGYKDLITTQNQPLEKITYQFTIHFFPELKETDLVLMYGNETVRDGKYNASDAFPTGWRFSPAGPDYKPITLPRANGKFAFSTTNFDDGWVSTVQEDWVQVAKGNVKVLLHYPTSKIDLSSADYKTISNNAWNTLVAPRYNSLNNFFLFGGSAEYERAHFVSADITENATGKKVHVALFKKGNSGWIEIISPDNNSFIQTFGLDITKIDYYVDSKVWEPLQKMANYNKFAVAATDLAGKWTNKFSGMQQFVNVYTGADAGMNTNSSTEVFEIAADNSYKWELKVASGMVGNIKYQGVKSTGKLTLPTNWQINFSDLEGKPKTYSAYFTCVKGARMLRLENAAGQTDYGKVE
jgi:hypothetical protein